MLFAQGAVGGPNLEALVLAVPMVVLGVVLFLQKTTTPIVPVVLVLAGTAIGGAGMTVLADDDHEAGGKKAAVNSYVGTVTGLCEARRVAADDPEEATRLFRDEAHVDLHALAYQAEDLDRSAAAGLLEAKQTVEADLDAAEVDGEELQHGLDAVLEATIAALRATDVEAPTC